MAGKKSNSAAGADNEAFQALSPKHRKFVTEYLKDNDATRAYMACYKSTLVSAQANARRLMRNDGISLAIAGFQQKVFEKAGITNERIIEEMARIGFFDPAKLFGEGGRPLDVTDLDDDTRAAIAGLDVLEEWDGSGQDRVLRGYVKKWKLADKLSALKELARMRGMYEKDNRQQGQGIAEGLQEFLTSIHSNGGSRLPIAPK